MENYCKGLFLGMAVGLVIGGIAVAKNKKLAGQIKEKMSMAEEKIEEAKEMIQEKIQESGANSQNSTQNSNQESMSSGSCFCGNQESDNNKKSKK